MMLSFPSFRFSRMARLGVNVAEISLDLTQGTYRVRGDVIDIFPAESEREALRVELFDDEIDSPVEILNDV